MNINGLENDLRDMEIQECLNQLKEQERQIIVLYYWWGYKDAEIGELLCMSQQLINYKRKKAHLQIKEKLMKL